MGDLSEEIRGINVRNEDRKRIKILEKIQGRIGKEEFNKKMYKALESYLKTLRPYEYKIVLVVPNKDGGIDEIIVNLTGASCSAHAVQYVIDRFNIPLIDSDDDEYANTYQYGIQSVEKILSSKKHFDATDINNIIEFIVQHLHSENMIVRGKLKNYNNRIEVKNALIAKYNLRELI